MTDIDTILASAPVPQRRRRRRRTPEIEQAAIAMAAQGHSLAYIGGALGYPPSSVNGWLLRKGDFATRLREAVDAGLELNSEIDRQRFIARTRQGAATLGAMLPGKRRAA